MRVIHSTDLVAAAQSASQMESFTHGAPWMRRRWKEMMEDEGQR